MCGIAGIVDFRGSLEGTSHRQHVEQMCEEMRHRGPDDGAVVAFNNCVLGHRRLSIIDLTQDGRQPLCNEDRSVWVVFNGEIYNHLDLRKKLIASGHRLSSRTDTEVLVHGYEEWGLDGLVNRLRGMFAFALYDSNVPSLYLVRDRLGVKPLHFLKEGSKITFASEVHVLYRSLRSLDTEVHPRMIDFYLTFGNLPADKAFVDSITKVPPATVFEYSEHGLESRRYWSLSKPYARYSVNQAVEDIGRALDDAVRVRLESDVPLGAFLSGGIDSGLVVANAVRHVDRPLSTFTVHFGEFGGADERALAQLVATKFGTEHEELGIDGDDISALPRLLYLTGEPFADTSLVYTARVSAAARRHVTVALTGDGGDDILAGYRRVHLSHVGNLLRALPGSSALAQLGTWLSRGVGDRLGQRMRTLIQYADLPMHALYEGVGNAFTIEERKALYASGNDGREAVGATSMYIRELASRYEHLDRAEAYMRMDFDLRLPARYLTKVDIASSAHSLECRSPFLDQELASAAARIPAAVKLLGLQQKGLLRRVARDSLPPSVVGARKKGFDSNIGAWFRGSGASVYKSLISEGALQDLGLFHHKKLVQLIERHLSARVCNGQKLWQILCLEIWWRMFGERAESANVLSREISTLSGSRS